MRSHVIETVAKPIEDLEGPSDLGALFIPRTNLTGLTKISEGDKYSVVKCFNKFLYSKR